MHPRFIGFVLVCLPIYHVFSLKHAAPQSEVDWDARGFGLTRSVCTDKMWLDRIAANGDESYSEEGCLVPLGPIALHPASTVLNYGQGLLEGLKAFRQEDGSIVLFRPDMNAIRMGDGAKRFLMPPVPVKTFVKAAEEVVRANARWVPPFGKGALYLRPIQFGSGEGLGVGPSSECAFCIYADAVGNYFKGGLKAIHLEAVKGFARAAPGGVGHVKAIGNYAPAMKVQKAVKARGFDEALFLDAISGEAVEEAGASNFFVILKNNTLLAPSLLPETILPGVTRASVIELAKNELGLEVVETRVTLEDLKEGIEAFCCGTGASITPVASVTVSGGNSSADPLYKAVFGDGEHPGPKTRRLYELLQSIQTGTDGELCRKYCGWIHEVKP